MNNESLSIAITGASGFIGKHLISDLQFTKHKIKLITRNSNYLIPPGISTDNFEIVKADLTDLESLINAFAGVDLIVNLAAEVRNYNKVYETNVAGTKNLIQAAVKNKVKKIIHLSSVGVVGLSFDSREKIVFENEVCKPQNEYEKTKFESETLLSQAAESGQFNLVVLRPTNVFGEQHPFNALLHLMKFIKSGKSVLLTKNAWVNYVYVKDLTQLIVQFINHEIRNEIYNVGESMPLNKLYDVLFDLLNKKKKRIFIPPIICSAFRAAGIKKLNSVSSGIRYSDSKLKTLFTYHYGLEKGLNRTFDFYCKQQLI